MCALYFIQSILLNTTAYFKECHLHLHWQYIRFEYCILWYAVSRERYTAGMYCMLSIGVWELWSARKHRQSHTVWLQSKTETMREWFVWNRWLNNRGSRLTRFGTQRSNLGFQSQWYVLWISNVFLILQNLLNAARMGRLGYVQVVWYKHMSKWNESIIEQDWLKTVEVYTVECAALSSWTLSDKCTVCSIQFYQNWSRFIEHCDLNKHTIQSFRHWGIQSKFWLHQWDNVYLWSKRYLHLVEKAYIAQGANIEASSDKKFTPLMLASENGYLPVVEVRAQPQSTSIKITVNRNSLLSVYMPFSSFPSTGALEVFFML